MRRNKFVIAVLRLLPPDDEDVPTVRAKLETLRQR